MTANYAQTIDAIAAINAEVSGVNIAFDSTNLPYGLNTLPAALVLLGPDDYTKYGSTEYMIMVYVALLEGTNPALAYSKCLSLCQAFRDTYADIDSINGHLLGPTHLTTKMGFGNTGFASAIKWEGVAYYGFQIHLPLTIADDEP